MGVQLGYSEGTVVVQRGYSEDTMYPLSSPQWRRENTWIGGGGSFLCFQSVLVVFHLTVVDV